MTDRELRSLRASGLPVKVIAPATDDPSHSRAVAERVAALSGAARPGPGFPETPRPGFAEVRGPFCAALLALLAAGARRGGEGGGPPGSPAAAGQDEPCQDEAPEQ